MIDLNQPIHIQLRMLLVERVEDIVGRERFNNTARSYTRSGNFMRALIADSVYV